MSTVDELDVPLSVAQLRAQALNPTQEDLMHKAPIHCTADELRDRIASPATPAAEREAAERELDYREGVGYYPPNVVGAPPTTRPPVNDGGLVDPMATER